MAFPLGQKQCRDRAVPWKLQIQELVSVNATALERGKPQILPCDTAAPWSCSQCSFHGTPGPSKSRWLPDPMPGLYPWPRLWQPHCACCATSPALTALPFAGFTFPGSQSCWEFPGDSGSHKWHFGETRGESAASGIITKNLQLFVHVRQSKPWLAAPAPQDCSFAPHKPWNTWAGAKLTAQTKCDRH